VKSRDRIGRSLVVASNNLLAHKVNSSTRINGERFIAGLRDRDYASGRRAVNLHLFYQPLTAFPSLGRHNYLVSSPEASTQTYSHRTSLMSGWIILARIFLAASVVGVCLFPSIDIHSICLLKCSCIVLETDLHFVPTAFKGTRKVTTISQIQRTAAVTPKQPPQYH
jgi:hypothetical protein